MANTVVCRHNDGLQGRGPAASPASHGYCGGMNVTRLTRTQREELARCYARMCGVDPQDGQTEWNSEMIGARRFMRDVLCWWGRSLKPRPGGDEQ